jgi:hypothetical protein
MVNRNDGGKQTHQNKRGECNTKGIWHTEMQYRKMSLRILDTFQQVTFSKECRAQSLKETHNKYMNTYYLRWIHNYKIWFACCTHLLLLKEGWSLLSACCSSTGGGGRLWRILE